MLEKSSASTESTGFAFFGISSAYEDLDLLSYTGLLNNINNDILRVRLGAQPILSDSCKNPYGS